MNWKLFFSKELLTLAMSALISYWALLFFQIPITHDTMIGGTFGIWLLPTLFEARAY